MVPGGFLSGYCFVTVENSCNSIKPCTFGWLFLFNQALSLAASCLGLSSQPQFVWLIFECSLGKTSLSPARLVGRIFTSYRVETHLELIRFLLSWSLSRIKWNSQEIWRKSSCQGARLRHEWTGATPGFANEALSTSQHALKRMFQPRGSNLWSQVLYGSKIYLLVFKCRRASFSLSFFLQGPSLSFLPYLILYLSIASARQASSLISMPHI